MLIKNHKDLRNWIQSTNRYLDEQAVEQVENAIDFDVYRDVSFGDNWTRYLGNLPKNLLDLLR